MITKGGSILELGSLSIQLRREDNSDNLADLVITKESKRTKSVCCTVTEKPFGRENVIVVSVP